MTNFQTNFKLFFEFYSRIPEEPEERIPRDTDSPKELFDIASLGQFTASSSDNLFIVSETNNTQSSVASNSKTVRKESEIDIEDNTVETPPPLPAPRKETSKNYYSKIEKSDGKSDTKSDSKSVKSSNSLPTQISEEKLHNSDFFLENPQPVQKQRRRGRGNQEKTHKLASDDSKHSDSKHSDSKHSDTRHQYREVFLKSKKLRENGLKLSKIVI